MFDPSLLTLQAVVTGVWAVATVFFSSFGYTTMRTGAHMADTGTEHNIELIVGVSPAPPPPPAPPFNCPTLYSPPPPPPILVELA